MPLSWLSPSVAALKHAIRFATYDWTREMAPSRRAITMVGMGIQGYAIWAGLSRSLIWPIMWPQGLILYPIVLLIYYIGFCLQNSMLAWELIRKTQLESELRQSADVQSRRHAEACSRRIATGSRSTSTSSIARTGPLPS